MRSSSRRHQPTSPSARRSRTLRICSLRGPAAPWSRHQCQRPPVADFLAVFKLVAAGRCLRLSLPLAVFANLLPRRAQRPLLLCRPELRVLAACCWLHRWLTRSHGAGWERGRRPRRRVAGDRRWAAELGLAVTGEEYGSAESSEPACGRRRRWRAVSGKRARRRHRGRQAASARGPSAPPLSFPSCLRPLHPVSAPVLLPQSPPFSPHRRRCPPPHQRRRLPPCVLAAVARSPPARLLGKTAAVAAPMACGGSVAQEKKKREGRKKRKKGERITCHCPRGMSRRQDHGKIRV